MNVKAILDEYGLDYREDDKRYITNCPFHDDSNPSLGIWKDSGYFLCFGCQETGDLADLIGEITGAPSAAYRRKFREALAVDELEDRVHKYLQDDVIELKYFSRKSFEKIYPPVEPDTPAWEYLTGKTRKLNEQTINRFNMRVGVNKYRNRVVLPIYTPDGRLLSYVGRALKANMKPKTKKARSPHRTLFGLFELLRDIKTDSGRYNIVVVEGEFDAIYLQQCGVPAVSNMGTVGMNAYKIALLRKYASRVILSYDPDEAGEGAMYGKEIKRGWKPGEYAVLSKHVPTVTVDLPGKDPNDLTEEEVEEVYGGWL